MKTINTLQNLTSLESKLNKELISKGIEATKGQLTYVCNSDCWLTDGKTFNQKINASYFLPHMVDNFLKFRNLNKFESDFNTL